MAIPGSVLKITPCENPVRVSDVVLPATEIEYKAQAKVKNEVIGTGNNVARADRRVQDRGRQLDKG